MQSTMEQFLNRQLFFFCESKLALRWFDVHKWAQQQTASAAIFSLFGNGCCRWFQSTCVLAGLFTQKKKKRSAGVAFKRWLLQNCSEDLCHARGSTIALIVTNCGRCQIYWEVYRRGGTYTEITSIRSRSSDRCAHLPTNLPPTIPPSMLVTHVR